MKLKHTIQFYNQTLQRDLRPVLKAWLTIHQDFSKKVKDEDALYFYNERATLSTLAGAAWKCGFYALEEYASYKTKKRKLKNGRTDLWLRKNDHTEYVIEAKQVYVSMSPAASKTEDKIVTALDEAKRDAKASRNQKQGLGIVFVVPEIPPSKKAQVGEYVTAFIGKLEQIPCDLLSYTFVEDIDYLPEGDAGYFYPGVALVASCC